MGSKVRLCVFTPHLHSGGIEERMARVIAGLDRHRFELSWMAFGGANLGVNAALLARAGRSIDVVTVDKRHTRIGPDLRLVAAVAEALKTRRPDVVHVHNWSVSF